MTDFGSDPLGESERKRIMAAAKPRRRLQVLPSQRVHSLLPLRDKDAHQRPVYAVWELTLKCDLACRHCGSRAGRARSDELSTDEALSVVTQLASLGVHEVTLIGGEAYLREDWTQIASAIVANGMKCTMTTGGRGMNQARAEAAARAGISAISVSLDGLEDTHDRLRSVVGSYASALRALGTLRAAGIRALCNTQINRLSMPQLPALLDVLLAHGVKHWMLIVTMPMGRAADEPDVLLQPYDLLNLFPMLAALSERAQSSGLLLQPSNNLGYFGPYEHILRGHLARGYSSSCGAGRSTVGIEANGDVKGCPSLPTSSWVGGNLRDASLQDIWQRTAPLRYTRDRTLDDLWGYCRSCYYADVCMAGCTWSSQVLLGRPGNNPYCHHRALEHAKMGKRERVVPLRAAPGVPFDHGGFKLITEALDGSSVASGVGENEGGIR